MNITCYDIDGNLLKTLTQWDINQQIVIKNLSLTNTPEVHYCNSNRELALVGESTYADGTLTTEVPNVLLQESIPIIIYIYVPKDDGSAKTTYSIRIPVNPRPKPADYEFSNNAQFITYQELLETLNRSAEVIELANMAADHANKAAVLAEESMEYFKDNFANALKGSASGETITINDASPIEHNANVWVHGKNLFNGELFNGLFTNNEFELSLTNSNVWKSIKIFLKAGTYTISFGLETNIVRVIIDNAWGIVGVQASPSHTFTTKTDGYVGCSFRDSTSSETAWVDATPIQIETGETATEYTAYIDPTTVTLTEGTTSATYTPNTDGLCEVVSVSPTMTLSTNTAGVTIQCDYNKDTNKAMGDVEVALDSIITMQESLIGGAE